MTKPAVYRINLKTEPDKNHSRDDLINFCLTKSKEKQYVAIGWSYVYRNLNKGETVDSFQGYFDLYQAEALKNSSGKRFRVNPVMNIFRGVRLNDLFWTRDMDGHYWICRVKEGEAKTTFAEEIPVEKALALDIGAVVPVEAYKYGMEVLGGIKASFNHRNGGTAQRLSDDLITAFSMYVFNKLSGFQHYDLGSAESLKLLSKKNIIQSLPDFELEELVISYIQVKHDYYLLSNSIAKKSTTVKVECELLGRNPAMPKKAVVQVKGPKYSKTLSATSFQAFLDDGYTVFLYANECDDCGLNNVVIIPQWELEQFYSEYKSILPSSITMWENVFETNN